MPATMQKLVPVPAVSLTYRSSMDAYRYRRSLEDSKLYAKVTVRRQPNYGRFMVTAYVPGEVEVRIRHRGTCQVCGGSFVVDGGQVVLHGYKRPRWGYIVGRCSGHNHEPAEKNIDLAQSLRANLTLQADAIEAQMGPEPHYIHVPTEARRTGKLTDEQRAYLKWHDDRSAVRNYRAHVDFLTANVLPQFGKPLTEEKVQA